MQIYADVIGRPMKISRSDQTCALGAAIFGAIAAGTVESGYDSVADAQRALCRLRETVYQPNPANHALYVRLYGLYRQLHDAFGTQQWSGHLGHVMKELLNLRDEVRPA